MKTPQHTAMVLIALLALLSPKASALSISQLRLQERHFALADFKTIYKERRHIQQQLLKKQRRRRAKNISRSALSNPKAQRGPRHQSNQNGMFYGMPNNPTPQNGTSTGTIKPGKHQFNNPWGTKH